MLLSAVSVVQPVIFADDQTVNTDKLRTLPVANIQAGARLGPAGSPGPVGLVHGLLDGVRQLRVQSLGEVEDQEGRHQAQRAEGEEGQEARHGGGDQLAQQDDLRGQEGAHPAEECAGAHPHGPDNCGEDLAAVEEDDAEAGDDCGLANEGESGDDCRDVCLAGGKEMFEENQRDAEHSAQS